MIELADREEYSRDAGTAHTSAPGFASKVEGVSRSPNAEADVSVAGSENDEEWAFVKGYN